MFVVDIGEDRAKPVDRSTLGSARYKEERLNDVAVQSGEQPLRTKGTEKIGETGWMLPYLTGVFVGLSLSALSWKPVPGVKKTAPRGEFALKKLAGKLFGAEKASGTASQLISRRPSGNELPTPLLSPRNARKSSTAVWMSVGLAPDASNTTGAATAMVGSERIKVANAILTLCMICNLL
jgi:hypothetical protein